MQKKCDQTVYSCVSGALEGTLPYGTYDKLGLADGVVGSADNENFRSIFTEEQIAALQVKVRREKQLNKQVQLNAELKRLKKELEEL